MNFKTIIDKIIEGGKLALTQPTFIFKNREEVPFTTYEVKAEDAGRIDLIAEQLLGDKADVEYLLKFNGISDPFSINEGDILKVPYDGQQIIKLERPSTVVDNIIRQEFIEGKKLTKKDQRRLDFLKKKYKIKEVLPPNVLKSGFKNFEITKEGDTVVTNLGMGTSTPESSFPIKKTETSPVLNEKIEKINNDPELKKIVDKAAGKGSKGLEQLTDKEVAMLENNGIKTSEVAAIKDGGKELATTFDGTVISNQTNSTSNVTTSIGEAFDEDGNKIGNQSVNRSELIEGDKITKTVTKTIVKPDGSSETTQTVTFSKYEGK